MGETKKLCLFIMLDSAVLQLIVFLKNEKGAPLHPCGGHFACV